MTTRIPEAGQSTGRFAGERRDLLQRRRTGLYCPTIEGKVYTCPRRPYKPPTTSKSHAGLWTSAGARENSTLSRNLWQPIAGSTTQYSPHSAPEPIIFGAT